MLNLVDSVPFIFLRTESSQGDEVAMMQPAQEFHFAAELGFPLLRTFVHALDSGNQPIFELALVDSAEPPLTDNVTEVFSGALHFVQLVALEKR